jgi:predicted RNA binding protein YcfA (HicA-like mRNA interferase family)
MSQYPSLTGKQIVSLLKKKGFLAIRQKGSHVFMQHPDGRATVVPIHFGETIGLGLLAKILKDVELTKEELVKVK